MEKIGEDGWYINPDVSAVVQNYSVVVPTKYWVVTVIAATLDGSGNIITPETVTVTSMTDIQIAAYDADFPPPPNYSTLPDGEPTYLYAPTGTYIGIAKSSITFTAQATTATNYYLNYGNVPSNLNGYLAPLKSVVTTITAAISNPVTDTVTFTLYNGTTVLETVAISAGQTFVTVTSNNTIIALGEILSVYISSTVAAPNPVMTLEIHKSW